MSDFARTGIRRAMPQAAILDPNRAVAPAGSAARGVRWRATLMAWEQAALMAVILAFTALLSRIGLGLPSRVFFVVAALASAGYYIKRSPWHYVMLTFWFWTLSPLARRLIDYNAHFDPVNFVLAVPNVLALFMLKDVLTSRELLRQRESALGLLLLLPLCYGLILSFIQGQILPGLAAAADWFVPVVYYYYVLANWRRIGEVDAVLRQFLMVNGLVIVGYSAYQYFAPPAWDAAWVIGSGMTSIGRPLPYELRIFGTLNAPGVLAMWLETLLLLYLHFRTRLTLILIPAGAIVLLMTLVRSSTGITVLGFVLAGLLGRAGSLKMLGTAVLVSCLVVTVVSALEPKVADLIQARFSTITALQNDDSALSREELYRQTPAWIDAYPFGMGIGALGRGAVLGENADFVTVDSGSLTIFLALGWIAGSLYLAGAVLVLAQAVLAARATRSGAAVAFAVAAAAGALNLIFTNINGFIGAVIWTCAALSAALAIAQRNGKTYRPDYAATNR